jgi:hypothetical protein
MRIEPKFDMNEKSTDNTNDYWIESPGNKQKFFGFIDVPRIPVHMYRHNNSSKVAARLLSPNLASLATNCRLIAINFVRSGAWWISPIYPIPLHPTKRKIPRPPPPKPPWLMLALAAAYLPCPDAYT